MMGVLVDGPTNVFCNNKSIFKNSTGLKSILKKKHNAIAYHRMREAITAGVICVAWEDGQFNLADVLTKLMPGPKLGDLVSCRSITLTRNGDLPGTGPRAFDPDGTSAPIG